MDTFDYDKLDPGIRETVRWLHEHGFRTSDSGDGVSKPEVGRTLDIPHVAIKTTPETMMADANRLLAALPTPLSHRVLIEATYSPIDGYVTLMLLRFSDEMLLPASCEPIGDREARFVDGKPRWVQKCACEKGEHLVTLEGVVVS